MDNEPENEITITVFRLLVLDLLALFQVLNIALINILGELDRDGGDIFIMDLLTILDRPLLRDVQGRRGKSHGDLSLVC